MALQCQSGSGTKPIYSRVLILHWPEGQQAADYLTGNTSCIVLNFAWSHWPGYFFIIHGNGRKAAKWIHAHASMYAYLKDGVGERFKEASGWKDSEVDTFGFTSWNIRAMWPMLLVRSCLCVHACVNSISPRAEKGAGVIQHRRHKTPTISGPAHITQALAADRHA